MRLSRLPGLGRKSATRLALHLVGREDGAGPAEELVAAKTRAAEIEGMELVIQANSGPEGKLFGSVGPIDIADAFEKVQVEVQRSEIRMPDGPIQELGDFPVGVHLHPDVNVEIAIRVVEAE